MMRALKPGDSVRVQTGFALGTAVPWRMDRPGRYVVIGCYLVEEAKGKHDHAYSAPLIIEVKTKDAP